MTTRTDGHRTVGHEDGWKVLIGSTSPGMYPPPKGLPIAWVVENEATGYGQYGYSHNKVEAAAAVEVTLEAMKASVLNT